MTMSIEESAVIRRHCEGMQCPWRSQETRVMSVVPAEIASSPQVVPRNDDVCIPYNFTFISFTSVKCPISSCIRPSFIALAICSEAVLAIF